jgi:hypothetical protein
MLLTRPGPGVPCRIKKKPTTKPRIANPAASFYINISWGGFKTNKFALWPHVSLQFLQPLRVLAAYGTCKVLSPQWLNLPKRSSNLEKGSMRVRGRGFAFHRFPWGDCDITVYLSWSFSCATQLLFSCWPVIVFSLFTAVAYCPVADCGWPENLIVLTGF